MCGIAGLLDPRGRTAPACLATLARAMAERLRHRGPDDDGGWADAQAGLAFAFRRLAIIDVSPTGAQPMVSADGRIVLMQNGEIYNYQAIRAALEAAGPIAWRGHSDTEVLVEAVARWGFAATLVQLNGMFAIAAWDRDARILHLARDRMGEKPLYYGRVGGTVGFASELKAFKAHPAWAGEIDRGTLALYLRHGAVPAPASIYRDIAKLAPGHRVEIAADGRVGAPVPYWDARDEAEAAAAAPFTGDDGAATDALERLIDDAVRLRLVADVPLGVFLSGGIDSTAVTAAMCASGAGPVESFSIGFEDPRYDESGHAAAVARHLGTTHTELSVTDRACRDILPRLATVYDEPFADASQIPTLVLSELTRRHVTVALSGDGGDELFGGYPRYADAAAEWRRTAAVPGPLRAAYGWLAHALPAATLNAAFGWTGALARRRRRMRPGDRVRRRLGRYGHERPERLYRDYMSLWREEDGLAPDLIAPTSAYEAPAVALATLEQRFMYLDAVSYLPDDLLVKVDRASMAASLETRAPLLDHRIVEFSWSLPPPLRRRGPVTKWLLREAVYRRVPRALVDRPKQGFEPPVGDWLRGPLADWAEDLLDARRLREQGLLSVEPVRRRWREHRAGERNWTYPLWCVLMLQAWLVAEGG